MLFDHKSRVNFNQQLGQFKKKGWFLGWSTIGGGDGGGGDGAPFSTLENSHSAVTHQRNIDPNLDSWADQSERKEKTDAENIWLKLPSLGSRG